jgi:hypothetical protein
MYMTHIYDAHISPVIVCLALAHVRRPVKKVQLVDDPTSLVVTVLVSQEAQNEACVALACKNRGINTNQVREN